MERRNFLKWLGAGSVLAGLGVIGLSSFQSSIKDILLSDTADLPIPEEVIDRFVAEAEKEQFWQQFDLTKKGFIVGHTWLAHSWLGSEYLPYRLKYKQYRSRIVGTFLLSTDYFTNKMQAKEPIRYTTFYNPYKTACASPFSNFYYPDTA